MIVEARDERGAPEETTFHLGLVMIDDLFATGVLLSLYFFSVSLSHLFFPSSFSQDFTFDFSFNSFYEIRYSNSPLILSNIAAPNIHVDLDFENEGDIILNIGDLSVLELFQLCAGKFFPFPPFSPPP